jgi:hypothetical protein
MLGNGQPTMCRGREEMRERMDKRTKRGRRKRNRG